MEQHGTLPFETFTCDGLFDDMIESWKDYVVSADPKNRTFTYSAFKNGKIVLPEISELIWQRLKPLLPFQYTDARNKKWRFVGVTKYVMYAAMEPGQSFPIHTDTGTEYSVDGESKFTVLIYLNKEFEGGNTQFYDTSFQKTFTIQPCAGRVLAFDIDLFHAGMPVENGTKLWIGTELICKHI